MLAETSSTPTLALEQVPDVVWIGLSQKPGMEGSDQALLPTTLSGALLATIEERIPNLKFGRTNVVDFAPLEGKRLRYPSAVELEAGWRVRMQDIISVRPKLVLLLGSLVAESYQKASNVKLVRPSLGDCPDIHFDSDLGCYISWIHHPSYIQVYKRQQKDVFCNMIVELIGNALGNEQPT